MLEYKLKWNSKHISRVDTFYPSSKLCSVCNYKNTLVILSMTETSMLLQISRIKDMCYSYSLILRVLLLALKSQEERLYEVQSRKKRKKRTQTPKQTIYRRDDGISSLWRLCKTHHIKISKNQRSRKPAP
jgi:hypothetical protein